MAQRGDGVRFTRPIRVACTLLLLPALAACSATGVQTVNLRRPYHPIKTVAIIRPGRLSEAMAAGIDLQRFVVLGPSETGALFDELGIKTSACCPPNPKACRLLAAAGVDIVVSGESTNLSDWCEWQFFAQAYSVRTCSHVATVRWCQQSGTERPDSLALATVGREVGRELGRRLQQVSAPE